MFRSILRAAALLSFAFFASHSQATVVYASTVISANSTGLKYSNQAINADRLIAEAALGNESSATASSAGFYSLGFGGSLTLGFSGLFGEGNITFFETTNGIYPAESAEVFVFDLLSNMFVLVGNVGNAASGYSSVASISGLCLSGCSALKIVDTTQRSDYINYAWNSLADGYDVNAVSANLFTPALDALKVPEPGTIALLSLGLLSLALTCKKRAPSNRN